MKYLRYATMFAVLMLLPLACAQAQVRIGVVSAQWAWVLARICCAGLRLWLLPDYPYACAPYGYYGPEWFSGGIFIGAGPWYHGWDALTGTTVFTARFLRARRAGWPRI